MEKSITIKDLTFKKYSSFAPEQWLVYKYDKIIGYIRLRHGLLSVSLAHEIPITDEDYEGFTIDETIFTHQFDEELPCFENDEDTITWFNKIVEEFDK